MVSVALPQVIRFACHIRQAEMLEVAFLTEAPGDTRHDDVVSVFDHDVAVMNLSALHEE